MASQNYEKAKTLWHSFYQDVMYRQRYFISHPILEKLKGIASKCEMAIQPGAIYYVISIYIEHFAKRQRLCRNR